MPDDLISRIRSKAHWDVVIRPDDSFENERVDYGQLEELLATRAVSFRGWPVPMVDLRASPLRGEDWIGQDVDAAMVDHYEAWRLYCSGQFLQLRSVSADWDRSRRQSPQRPRAIEVWEIVYYLTELYELAARLCLSEAGGDPMWIGATLNQLESRRLIVGQSNRVEFFENYHFNQPPCTVQRSYPRDTVVAESRRLAADAARRILVRSGWKPSVEQLMEHQQELIDSRKPPD